MSCHSLVIGRVFVIAARTQQTAECLYEERRRSVRHAVVSQIAKIRLKSGREELCLLRDISPDGLRAEVYVNLHAGEELEIELRTAHGVKGRVAWAEGNMIGVAFAEPIPAAAMLAHCSFEIGGNLRPPRLKVDMRGLFRINNEAKMVSIANISLAGLQIAAPEQLRLGTACTIALPKLPACAATICWWRDGNAGLMLVKPFDYATFVEWRGS
ncbi:MAG TPA: PilZ domain-containing protein [Sphingomonas sp.]|nr:PilZ domain-containing protein [Sphingomonas sp.]